VEKVMEENSRKVLSHEDCRRLSLEELENADFQGYEMPTKYKRRVWEYRDTYGIQTPEQAAEDYKLGTMKGEYLRAKKEAEKFIEENPESV
jgi:hypothetical protein